ncbi:MAG: cyclase family protein [Candidatus Loosdrechtia sp.]|uniref:cyclase family protein n=1 Tax=Candidatus Loosdrechtia sp. TaxID=3101272 RepID=UPI003A7920D7|nr:MAG: cyclase family protein [Candidatus Jettenia sp. AMX2]
MDWIDVSVTIHSGMVSWPGDPDVCVRRVSDMETGDMVNLTRLDMSVHSGTHVDAPLHFLRKGKGITDMPLGAMIGEARVIEITDPESIKTDLLLPYAIEKDDRILFKTKNSQRDWTQEPFIEDFVYITTEAGRYLVECGIQTVGIDYLSVAGYKKNEVELHRLLLGADIWIIEGLNLSHVKAGRYELICLPIRIADSDGAPARVLLRPMA